MSASEAEQCRAITQSGDRCSRPAQEDGFCYMHDVDDETVDEGGESSDVDGNDEAGADGDADGNGDADADGENDDATAEADGDEEATEESDEETEDTGESDDGTETAEEGESGGRQDKETAMSSDNANVDTSEIGQVRDQVLGVAEDVVGHPLDGILAIDREDDSWRVAVEVVERSSVPDTQDILGRYEITLDEDRTVTGYRRTHRYRRDDMEQDI